MNVGDSEPSGSTKPATPKVPTPSGSTKPPTPEVPPVLETPKRGAEKLSEETGDKQKKQKFEKRLSPRTHAGYVEPNKLAKLLYTHLDSHENFHVGSYMKKNSSKEPASISEILDWSPTLMLCLAEIPSGVASSRNFAEGFGICLKNRPLANPLIQQQRLGFLFPQSIVINSRICI